MDYFAGLNISMDETHVCVLDREGVVVRESKTESTRIGDRRRVDESANLSSHRVRDRTNRADPVSRVEQAWSPGGLRREPAGLPGAQVACDPQDRSQRCSWPGAPRRTGFFKPVYVKSLRAHALRSLISARKKLVGQRVTLENQIRGLAVVFGVRLPRALTTPILHRPGSQSQRRGRGFLRRYAGFECCARRCDDCRRRDRRGHQTYDQGLYRGLPPADEIPGVGQLTALAFVAAIDDPSRIRRSRDIGACLGLVPRRYQSGEVGTTPAASPNAAMGGCERSCTRPLTSC